MNSDTQNGVASPHTEDSAAHGERLALELNNFVNTISTNTSPWPLRHITPNPHSFPAFTGHTLQQQSQLHYTSTQSFPDWRSAGLPSDPGTNGVDSGYGEAWSAFRWDETSSFQDPDCSTDTLNAGELLSGLEIGSNDNLTVAATSPPVVTESPFYCKGCNTYLRKKSELNKHAQRHNKPHRCDYTGCPKSRKGEGFSTTNDLIRHKKSVHGEHDKGPVYSCPYGPCAEKPDKVWPRADNFRSHLLRSHQRQVTADSDLSIYVKKNVSGEPSGGATPFSTSSKAPRMRPGQPLPDKSFRDCETGTAGVKEEDLILTDISLMTTMDEPTRGSSGATVDSSPMRGCSSSIAQNMDSTQDEQRNMSTDEFGHGMKLSQQPTHAQSLTAIAVAPGPRHSDWHPNAPTAPTTPTSGSEGATWQVSTFCDLQKGGMKPAQIIAFLKTFPKCLLKNALENDIDTSDRESTISAYSHQKNDSVCPLCGKTFARPSELKKHQKRHDRPYRCTFRGCTKRFGSKNDWKRHEKQQHEPIDAWVCNILGCRGVFSTAVLLQRHAQQDHGANRIENMQSFLDDCHIGNLENKKFWCGYCSAVIGLEMGPCESQNQNLWVARCDHIDGHLSGKHGLERKQFDQWIYLEDKISVDQYLDAPWNRYDETKTSRKRKGKLPSSERPAKRREDHEASGINCST